MLLRWLVSQYVAPAAQAHLRSAAAEMLRGGAKEVLGQVTQSGQESGQRPEKEELAPPCDLVFVFGSGLEAGGLVDRLENSSSTKCKSFIEHSGTLQGKEVVVIESGAGGTAASAATADVIAFHQPAWVVSAGFATGLRDELRRGHFLMADQLVNTKGEKLDVGLKLSPETIAASKGLHAGRLVTVDKVLRTESERRKLGQEQDSLASDMESFAIADACRKLATRFLCVRIITDAVDDRLPKEVERLMQQKTWMGKLGAAAQGLMSRPQAASEMWKLQDDALKASDRLAKFLVSMLPQLTQSRQLTL